VTVSRGETGMDKETSALPSLVLIVDDDPMICLLAEESLRQSGFRTHTVGTCQACLEALTNLRPDAILVDVSLPDGDGVTLCAQLQSRVVESPIPVALMTTYQGVDEKIQQAYQSGAYDVITKPVNWALLGQRVRNLLRIRQQQILQRCMIQQQNCLTGLMELSTQDLTLEGFLQRAIQQVLGLPWPGQTGCGGIFLADDQTRCLRLAVQVGLDGHIRKYCNQIGYGDCCCGQAANDRQLSFQTSRDGSGMITCEVGPDYDHFHVPLISGNRLTGLLVLFLEPGHRWAKKQKDFLKTTGKVLGGLIEHKRIEQQLSLAASVFEGSLEAVVILDDEMKILEVNRVFTDFTGFDANVIRGKSVCVLHPSLEEKNIPAEDDQALCAMIKRQLDSQGHWQGEVWLKRRNGKAFLGWLQLGRAQEGGRGAYVMVFADITDRQRRVEVIRQLAFYDQLTGLCNRSLLMDRLTLACRHAKREGTSVAVLFFDLDRFKSINDTLGHDQGDRMLSEVARRIRGVVREEDTAARLGGDEFVLLLLGLDGCHETARQQVGQIAEKISTILSRPVDLEGQEVVTSASIGIALAPGDSQDPHELIKLADLAMYAAKQQGGERYCFFQQEMRQGRVKRMNLEGKLRIALERESFAVYLQPRLRVSDQALVGVEALLRWWDEETEHWVPPEEFLPVAEQTGLIDVLDQWVLQRIGQFHQQWHSEGLCKILSQVAVNVSPRQFQKPGYASRTLEIIQQLAMTECCRPEIEVNEASLMKSPDDSLRTISMLKEVGVRFAVDDFGTGFSNLACLKRFQVDVLKIDQSLVHQCLSETGSASVIRAIVALAEELDLEVVAEGVETTVQLALLRQWNCHYYQGYLCAPALSPEEFEALLRNMARGE